MVQEQRTEEATLKIEIRIDEACAEPRLVIFTREVTPEINELVRKFTDLPAATAGYLIGYQDERLEILQPESIIRVYADQQKVFAQTEAGIYVLRMRLYEVEEKLSPAHFIRISNAEIVNFRKVKNLDMSLTGTICLNFQTGGKSFVSRRYIGKIKSYLGI